MLGSKFAAPDPPPAGYVIVGGAASLPAINSLLDSITGIPARVFLEARCDDDKGLPVAGSADAIWVDRKSGSELVKAGGSGGI